MAVRVEHDLHRFAADILDAPVEEDRKMSAAVDRLGRDGRRVAYHDAKSKAGRHGRHYPNAITQESSHSPGSWSTTWGPDGSMPQGNMNFEHGPGPQATPHLSIAISHDAVKPLIASRIGGVYDGGVYQ